MRLDMGSSVHALAQAGTPAAAAAAAGGRRRDVFCGIDVFGRGTYAGGQLSCDVAAAAARDGGGLSLSASVSFLAHAVISGHYHRHHHTNCVL